MADQLLLFQPVGTPATPVQSAWHWGCAETSQATNSSPQSRNTPSRPRLPGAHGYHGPAVHAAARRPPRPSASNMATRPLLTTTLVAKTPAFGSHAFMGHRTLCGTMSVCLSVCLLWSDGSIRQVARGGCAVAERPAAQHPGASWALRAPPFIYSPQGGEHFDHCC